MDDVSDRLVKLQESAVEKLKNGQELKSSEKASLEGRTFFSFCWNNEEYKDFVQMLNHKKLGCPNDIVWQLIDKFMAENAEF